jgi:rubrerythrin
MFDHLTQHTSREGAMLSEYAALAESTESNALRYVINMLLEDERRHHRYFNELAMSLKSESELSSEEPVVPRMDFDRLDRDDLRDVTERLLDHEKSDAKELERLRKELRDVKDTTLWGLLVEIMMRDTDKHISILKFVHQHAPSK